MDVDSLLRRLKDETNPSRGAKDRVRMMMEQRLPARNALILAREALTPTASQHRSVWQQIADRVSLPVTPTLFRFTFLKWTAAFAVVALVVRISPLLLLTPHTIAESAVLAIPTRGEVEVSAMGYWQPITSELTVRQPTTLRTQDGEVTVLFNDDGNVRIGPKSRVQLQDLTDRPEPGTGGPTLTVEEGRVWVQGFVAYHLKPLTVATPNGIVSIHEGSTSIQVQDGITTVRVWDRHAGVNNGESEDVILVAGEWTDVRGGVILPVRQIPDRDEDDEWVAQNMRRDAVHRRDLAQLQTERRASRAGILPNSPLYPVKRVAEEVDVLLTFGEQSKVQKRLDQASRRLDEAAALITAGESGATIPLEEFRQTMLAVAGNSGTNVLTQSLVQQEVVENAAALAASRPNDESYPLKIAILETSAALQTTATGVTVPDIQVTLLTDSIDTLNDALQIGDTELASEMYEDLKPQLETLENDPSINPDLRKEVLSSLEDAAEELEEDTGIAVIIDMPERERTVGTVIPEKPALTAEQRAALMVDIVARVLTFDQPRPQLNQLIYEVRRIEQEHPKDLEAMLHLLHRELPKGGSLSNFLRDEIQKGR